MGGWCDHVTLEPSRKVNSRPFNTISSTAIHTSTAWIDSGQSGNINYDYAVVEVGSNIGQQTGLFGFTSNSYKGLSITINGYPDDKMGDYGITQWLHTGTLTTIYDNTVETNNTDAAKGQSGGPFYNNNDEAVAIMTGQNASNNIGTRITGQLVNWLSTFR